MECKKTEDNNTLKAKREDLKRKLLKEALKRKLQSDSVYSHREDSSFKIEIPNRFGCSGCID